MDIKAEKAEAFALNIIQLYRKLTSEKNEWILSIQLLRSGTSIGANIAEANYAESKEDFVHKMAISQKEASETAYWLRLLYRSQFIDAEEYNNRYNECQELLRIITKIIVRSKQNG